MLAPSGGVEFLAAADVPGVEAMVEVSDADDAWQIAKKLGVTIRREIADTPYGARLFEVEVSGLRIGFLTYAKKVGEHRGLEAPLNATGKQFAIVVSRFNSFITERLLDGALLALRQCGANPKDISVVHVPGAFEIPAAARQLAQTGNYHAIICVGCLLRGGTLHYEVIANEVARGVGQSAQETGVPHAFGVLTCDTLEQAIDRAGLKAGNKGFEAALAAVEMASLRQQVAAHATSATDGKR
jgi:6,7-dimethyl-8-ribityllumazine synthase